METPPNGQGTSSKRRRFPISPPCREKLLKPSKIYLEWKTFTTKPLHCQLLALKEKRLLLRKLFSSVDGHGHCCPFRLLCVVLLLFLNSFWMVSKAFPHMAVKLGNASFSRKSPVHLGSLHFILGNLLLILGFSFPIRKIGDCFGKSKFFIKKSDFLARRSNFLFYFYTF